MDCKCPSPQDVVQYSDLYIDRKIKYGYRISIVMPFNNESRSGKSGSSGPPRGGGGGAGGDDDPGARR